MEDMISRQVAIDAIDDIESEVADGDGFQYAKWRKYFCELPSVQPEILACGEGELNVPDTNVGNINKFIDSLEVIFEDVRERHVDDSVCGLCEYDGAYMGQSGGWCNECPGFDRDDCFKLSDEIRERWTEEIIKALPSAQPESCEDAVSRRRLLNDLEKLTAAWGKYPVMAKQIKGVETAIGYVKTIPSVTPKPKTGRLSNKEWIDFLSEQFDISRTSARDMLHTMMSVKKEDNFKKQFNKRGDTN